MMANLNEAGENHLTGLINAGNVNAAAWTFTPDDEDALLGAAGDDWTRYGNVHLGIDPAADAASKEHWAYPVAKANGDTEMVYRSGLVAARDLAIAAGETDIEQAASRLIQLIDDADDADEDAAEGAAPAPPQQPAPAEASVAAATPRQQRAHDLPRLATRIFGTPLLVARSKLDVILGVLGPRVGLTDATLQAAQQYLDDPVDGEPSPYALTSDGIAVITIHGSLVYRSSWLDSWSGLVSYATINESLDAALADSAVKGILLDIDSYGGEANGVPDCADRIFAARAQKPVYAVAADSAYSAAYFIGAAAEKLFVSRTSGVGSIGTVALHVDQSAADAMDGVKYTYVFAGARKVDGNPHAPLSDPSRAAMQAEVDQMNALFVASVAKYRGLARGRHRRHAGGLLHRRPRRRREPRRCPRHPLTTRWPPCARRSWRVPRVRSLRPRRQQLRRESGAGQTAAVPVANGMVAGRTAFAGTRCVRTVGRRAIAAAGRGSGTGPSAGSSPRSLPAK
jgi:ClpP class serine protease